MTHRPALQPAESTVAEAPAVAATAKKAAARVTLQDDEIIQLSIRPSLWCIPLYSFKLLLALVLLAVAVVITTQGQPTRTASLALGVIGLAAFSAVLVATLHWASQIYVLTNRRVMRFHGVFSVGVVECGLRQIDEVHLERTWYHPLLRLGSLHMTPGTPELASVNWEHVARPAELHEIVTRAVAKARLR